MTITRAASDTSVGDARFRVKTTKSGRGRTVTITAQAGGDTDGVLYGYVADQLARSGITGATVVAAGHATETGTAGVGGYYDMALAADTYTVTGSADDYRSRVYPDVAVVSRHVSRLDLCAT